MANPPHRVHILGGPGSGKSYLAKRLGQALGLPVCDLDDLFWDNQADTYGVRADPEVRDRCLADFVEQDQWIVEGVYHQWLAPSFERSEVIVVLTPHVFIRDWRIVKRFVLRRLGIARSVKRETLAGLAGLLRWNHGYDKDNLARAMETLGCFRDKVRTFSSAEEAERVLLG